MDGMNKRHDFADCRFTKIDADLRDFRAQHHQDMMALHADLKQFYGITIKLV